MKTLTQSEFLQNKSLYIKEMQAGKIFVYPTDTIYGIGCDATNSSVVRKIRSAKKRDEKPFSVIAPNKNWIKENCIIEEKSEDWLNKLPGPYTLILKLKNKKSISAEVNSGAETLGVRIPDNWFSEVVAEFAKPFVTTSVNLSGEKPLTDLTDLNESMKQFVDYFIYEGKKAGSPSMIVNLVGEKEEIVKR